MITESIHLGMRKLIIAISILFSGLDLMGQSQSVDLHKYEAINPENVTIVRDTFGVPHIYGITDADAAYGLAWAHAEDDFKTIQINVLGAKGRLSEVQGIEGALMDVVGQLIFADETIQNQYD